MARRRRRPTTGNLETAPESGGQVEVSTYRAAADEADSRRAKHLMLFVIFGVFILFEVIVFVAFSSGSQIQWKKELTEIDLLYERGQYQDAASEIIAFGDRWAGAKNTEEWNRKVGLYHALAEDWGAAAKYYEAASALAPQKAELHARAGEAFWKAGNKDKAVELLGAELQAINPAVADRDRANYYLGLSLLEEGKYQQAFEHFQAVTDREKWKDELEAVYAKADEMLLDPARKRAEQVTVSELLAKIEN